MSKLDQAFSRAYQTTNSRLAFPKLARTTHSIPLSEAMGRVGAERADEVDGDAEDELLSPANVLLKMSDFTEGTSGSPLASCAEKPAANVPTTESLPVFRPMLQVEAFAWPPTLTEASEASLAQFDAAAAAILELKGPGPGVIGLVGGASKVGCTTTLLAVAARLAQRGMNIAMVDANEASPTLSSCLGLLPSLGWEDVVAGREPVVEALIESIEDRLTLLPLCNPKELARVGDATIASSRAAAVLAILRDHFDLVLVDLGIADAAGRPMDGAVDEAVLVTDARRPSKDDVLERRDLLERRGIACAGLIENFARSSRSVDHRRAA
ncbi:MAG TPA: hypothetical protein DD670_06535 [Planctomycetaceae bacterium]|nr:hypothetical protein [Planctomycetaceae bacterium]